MNNYLNVSLQIRPVKKPMMDPYCALNESPSCSKQSKYQSFNFIYVNKYNFIPKLHVCIFNELN